jgi:hypothetical protein
MSQLVIAPIVEGQGEVAALPPLVRRIANEIDPSCWVDVRRPIRVPRHKVVQPGQLERYVELAARSASADGAVLVLIDADDDCPATLGPVLLERASAVRENLAVSVVLAMREFEAWFLAAAVSLRDQRGLPGDLTAPADAEAVRDAKKWLQDRRTDGFAYSPTADQPALVAAMDLHEARSGAPSFDKLCRDIEQLVRGRQSGAWRNAGS